MSVIGVVLAGGKSSRMGQDKALLRLPNGKTLLEHSIELLNGLGLADVVISRATRPDKIAQDISCIADKPFNLGPLSGIAAVITARPEATALLIIPVDLPFLTDELLAELLERGQNLQCASYFCKHYLPCYLPINNTTTSYIAQQLENPDARRSVFGLLKNANALALPVDSNFLANANTPEEWQRVFRHYSSHSFKGI